MDKNEKQQKLIEWVRKKNETEPHRKRDYHELWEEIEPYFIECEGDNDLKLKLMMEATNFR